MAVTHTAGKPLVVVVDKTRDTKDQKHLEEVYKQHEENWKNVNFVNIYADEELESLTRQDPDVKYNLVLEVRNDHG